MESPACVTTAPDTLGSVEPADERQIMRRVLLIDDHPLFRQALAATISRIDTNFAIEQFDTLASVMAALGSGDETALILLDLKLPDSQGVAGLLSIKAHAPDVPVAIISAFDDPEIIQTAAACGAAGFVSKGVGVDQLSAAVETLLTGNTWFPASSETERRGVLTPTQTRIVDGVHRGLMNKQIAYELGLSEATIKYHLTGIFRALGVQTRSQLLALSSGGIATS